MHDLGGSPSQFRSDDIVIDENPYMGVESYRILSFLGKGGFAECYSAKVLSNGADVALKIVEKTKLRDSGYTKMKREINIHKMALHKNIVSMFDSFEDRKNFYLVLELCNVHSLLTIINNSHARHGYMDINLVRKYLFGILSAVDYLLDRNILHRDIKPGNIFIGSDGEVKLGDFGLAIQIKDLHSASVSGTPNYLAPEVLQRKGHSEGSEVWSIGCLLYCMMTGLPPFETESIEKTYIRIAHGDYKITMAIKAIPAVSEIISQCLSVNPKSRPRVKALKHHTWFVGSLSKDSQMVPRYLSNQASLTRTKSVGDMLKDANGNNYLKFARPKSTVGGLHDNSYLSDKTRRKSITGSHDSGFGSEVDMSRRPALMDRITQVQKDLRSILEQKFTLVPCSFTGIYISKWVDYSNSRGFACKLSDGSVTVKFNEGSCLTIPPYSTRFIYASSPFSMPKVCDMCTSRPSMESQLFDTAVVYGSYMDKELAGGQTFPYFRFSIVDAPYIVYYRLSSDHLIAVLSNGTIQINLFNEKVKIVLWKEDFVDEAHICVTFLTQGFEMQSFRIQPTSSTSLQTTSLISHLEDYFQHISTIISANCDLISPKKPPLSTEC